MEAGIAVFKRFVPAEVKRDLSGFCIRHPDMVLTMREILNRYRGIDGIVWPEEELIDFPIDGGLAKIADLVLVEKYVMRISRRTVVDLLGLSLEIEGQKLFEDVGWRSIGFDVGYFEGDGGHYSAILGEIFWSGNVILEEYARHLNQHLLFHDFEVACSFQRVRNELLPSNGVIEDWEVYPVEVFIMHPFLKSST